VVQALPSLHDAELLECAQPVAGLHESFVQMLPSLQLTRLPPPHTPALQTSPVVQALPSLHGSVFGVYTQAPVDGLQESVVQGLPSLHTRAVPAQAPAAQRSFVVQLLPSLQAAVLFAY
jgi:hypothetical protein